MEPEYLYFEPEPRNFKHSCPKASSDQPISWLIFTHHLQQHLGHCARKSRWSIVSKTGKPHRHSNTYQNLY